MMATGFDLDPGAARAVLLCWPGWRSWSLGVVPRRGWRAGGDAARACSALAGRRRSSSLALGQHGAHRRSSTVISSSTPSPPSSRSLILVGAAAGDRCWRRATCEDEGIERFEYPVLILFSALGMCMMVSANSLLALYMALELQSLPLYVLAAFSRDKLRSTEAGLKYFVLGALASGMLLYGCSLGLRLHRHAHRSPRWRQAPRRRRRRRRTCRSAPSSASSSSSPASPSSWRPCPSTCGRPTSTRARRRRSRPSSPPAPKIAAIGPDGAGADAALRRMSPASGSRSSSSISIASMLLGAFAAIGQTNIKRLMAYSGIGHIGFALVGLAAGTAARRLRRAGLHGDLRRHDARHLRLHPDDAARRALRRDDRRSGRPVAPAADAGGCASAIFMFSLAGIPPLAGFFGKLYVFMAAIDAGLHRLAVIGVLASVRRRLLLSADRQGDVFRRAGRAVRSRWAIPVICGGRRHRDGPGPPLHRHPGPARRGGPGRRCRAHARERRRGRPSAFAISTTVDQHQRSRPRGGWPSGEPEGSLVVAEEQTAGRGRHGRVWHSPPGNFYGSLLLRARPARLAEAATPVAGRRRSAVAEAIHDVAAWPARSRRLKWPNDVLLRRRQGRRHPARGSRAARADAAPGLVVGIGVNLRDYPDGRRLPRDLARRGRRLAADAGGLPRAAPRAARRPPRPSGGWRLRGAARGWLDAAAARGDPVRLRARRRRPVSGRFVDVDGDGALRLELEDGWLRASPPASCSSPEPPGRGQTLASSPADGGRKRPIDHGSQATAHAARHRRRQHQHRVRPLSRARAAGPMAAVDQPRAHGRGICGGADPADEPQGTRPMATSAAVMISSVVPQAVMPLRWMSRDFFRLARLRGRRGSRLSRSRSSSTTRARWAPTASSTRWPRSSATRRR